MVRDPLDIVFVTDPLERLQPGHDTSVALMEAAQERGHRVLVTTAPELSWVDGEVRARARRVDVRPARLVSGRWVTEDEWHVAEPPTDYRLDDAAVVFMRTDPPVDDAYWRATYLLGLVDPASTLVVNDPAGLRHANEKLFGLLAPELMPPTVVTADRQRVVDTVASWGRAVLKPTDCMAGRGIFVLDPADPNLASILDTATERGTVQVVVQQWVPQVDEGGDRRVIVVDGEPLGALARLAQPGDFRCNMATGGAVHADTVTDRDRVLCRALAPLLRQHGLAFVGLDVIGDFVTEINVTSPTGIREIDALSGTTLAHDVLAWAERTLRERV